MKKIILSLCMVLIASMQVQAQNWDINTVRKVNGWKTHDFSKVMSESVPLLPVGVPAAMGIYALIKKDQPLLKDAVYIGTSVIEALGVTYALKYSIDRLRPYEKYPGMVRPSLSITYPKWYIIAPSALWACGVGYARINQGVHYPSDVLAGAVIGTGCAFLNIYINRWLNKVLFE